MGYIRRALSRPMTALLKQAVDAVSELPVGLQDEYAQLLLRLLGVAGPPIELSDEEDADLAEAEHEVARGEVASDAEVAALWTKRRV
jgi:hypothetical protein